MCLLVYVCVQGLRQGKVQLLVDVVGPWVCWRTRSEYVAVARKKRDPKYRMCKGGRRAKKHNKQTRDVTEQVGR